MPLIMKDDELKDLTAYSTPKKLLQQKVII